MQKVLRNNSREKQNLLVQGFTLIELMVVVAIIAILTILFINSSAINIQRGRDAKRKTDLENIRSGLETYRSDCNIYPVAITFGSSLKGSGATTNCPITNTYINLIPQDPITGRSYLYSSNGTTYTICASLEVGSNPTVTCGGSSTCGSGTCNYQVTNP